MLAWMHRLTGVSRIDLYRTASLVGRASSSHDLGCRA